MSETKQGIFGIDLGTTYSVVSYIDDSGRAAVMRNSQGFDTTPSVVYFENEDNVVVGKTAKEAAAQYPEQVVALIKRDMGDRDYRRTFFGVEHTPPSISALILKALAREAEAETGRKVTDVVITVPAYFGLLEKDATRKAGEIAGLNVIGIVPEPVAAALQYGVTGGADGTTVLVYDLGGGTFDVSLIRMSDTSIEVLVVGGDHRLGGADWDEKLLDHLVERTAAECGDDALRDDESMLQDLRILAEETKKALSTADTKTQIVRYTGTPAKITVSRAQFEQMTADLLDETIRITSRTLAEAEEKYPGVGQQISEVLLVGGSSKMPAVSEALRKEFGWDPKLADPDLAVAKGAALYAAGQTVRYVDKDQPGRGAGAPGGTGDDDLAAALAAPGPVTEEAVQAVADQTGLREEDVRRLAQRTVVNVLPKAIGVKLVDTTSDGWEDDVESALYVEHLVAAQTQLPFQREPFVAGTVAAQQSEIEIEIWEQAGGSPGRELAQNHALDANGRIRGLQSFALPAGSPIHIDIGIDAEGTVHLRAVEPASRHEVQLEVRISILSAEQVVEAKRAHAGLTVST
ncbi:MAG: Hsp70 family protein [Streptosporangiaceae bacterium]